MGNQNKQAFQKEKPLCVKAELTWVSKNYELSHHSLYTKGYSNSSEINVACGSG
jgi:hypothetical protein